MEIGAQLYTVRSMTQTLEGLAEALKKVADIGYKTVQLSGTCPYDAEWMREQLARNGLCCVLTHTPVPRLTGGKNKKRGEAARPSPPFVPCGVYCSSKESFSMTCRFRDGLDQLRVICIS